MRWVCSGKLRPFALSPSFLLLPLGDRFARRRTWREIRARPELSRQNSPSSHDFLSFSYQMILTHFLLPLIPIRPYPQRALIVVLNGREGIRVPLVSRRSGL